MPDAMMNGGFAPYLAQAFTPQGVPGGLFSGSVGNVPGINYGNPFSQSYGIAGGMPLGGVPGLGAMPQIGQQHLQPYTGWQQQVPQPPQVNPFGHNLWQGGTGLGWPYNQVQPWQTAGQFGTPTLGQPFAQPSTGSQEPQILAHLLRQYAVPISAAMATPYGQAQIAQNFAQSAEMLTRLLPLIGVPQLVPLAQVFGQWAQPISAAITTSPYGQAHIAQNVVRMAEIVERVLPLVATQQLGWPFAQPNIGWQQQVPQFPIASLLGQQYPQLQQQLGGFGQFSGLGGGQYGQGQLGPFSAPSGDSLARMLPFLTQQGLGSQGYGMARV